MSKFFTPKLILILSLLSIIVVPQISQADESAKRKPGSNYEDYIKKNKTLSLFDQTPDSKTVQESRTKLDGLDLSTVPEVSPEILKVEFARVRDALMLQDSLLRARRPTWFYPDDGCYARAELMIEAFNATKPAKIFAFGNLEVQTSHHPSGYVSWWYHVAPIVKSGEHYYVLDPALDPLEPQELKAWLEKISLKDGEVVICSSHAYKPSSHCNESASQLGKAVEDEAEYLELEWDRVVELGLDPELTLGKSPPWP